MREREVSNHKDLSAVIIVDAQFNRDLIACPRLRGHDFN